MAPAAMAAAAASATPALPLRISPSPSRGAKRAAPARKTVTPFTFDPGQHTMKWLERRAERENQWAAALLSVSKILNGTAASLPQLKKLNKKLEGKLKSVSKQFHSARMSAPASRRGGKGAKKRKREHEAFTHTAGPADAPTPRNSSDVASEITHAIHDATGGRFEVTTEVLEGRGAQPVAALQLQGVLGR